MALIKCPECGREISDKASCCPGCGCPANEFSINVGNLNTKSREDLLFEEVKRIHRIYPTEKAKAIKAFREYSGWGLKEAKAVIDKEYSGEDVEELLRVFKSASNYKKIEKIEKDEKVNQNDTYRKGGFFTKVKCPRCNSIEFQVVDTKKKFSLGKAVVGNTVGGLVFGPAGAIIGGATGIKGKNGKTKLVCSHCGKVWEQKV